MELLDCAITNACHCAPPLNKPTAEEISDCRCWLDDLLVLMRPTVFLGQRTEEPFTATISREHPSCTIGPVGTRSKTDHQQSCGRVAKVWDRTPPIFLFLVCPPLGNRNISTVIAETGTSFALHNVGVKTIPRLFPIECCLRLSRHLNPFSK